MNPLVGDGNYEATSTCEIDGRTNSVRLYPVSGNPTIYINDTGNSPAILLYEAMTIENVDGQILRLHITGSGTANIKQYSAVPGRKIRV